MSFKKNILCIGAGYVGGSTMAVIAFKCPDYSVNIVDINQARIDAWNSDKLPVYEPGLYEVIKKSRNKNLFFHTNIEAGIREADIIFVSVNTPTKSYGAGAGMAADLQFWEKTARTIRDCADRPKIIVEKSTLPVRTVQAMETILNGGDTGICFDVLSNPEFLAEGTAIQDLFEPDRVLIGSKETDSGFKARQELVDLYAHWVPLNRIITSNIWSAELSKLVANAFLAQRVSSINAISALCEATEANVSEVAYAVGSDARIGSRFLNASVGFGGSCFQKDILNLVYLCRHYGLYEVADYWHSVVTMNDYQKKRFVTKMLSSMFNTLAEKKIALFGFAFKADTSDTRESPAIYITRHLAEEHAKIVITDPRALENARIDLADVEGNISYETDPYEAARESDAVAVMTEWQQYKDLDWEKIYDSMRKPAFLFDGRNMLDHNLLYKIGFNVYPIGKSALTHLLFC